MRHRVLLRTVGCDAREAGYSRHAVHFAVAVGLCAIAACAVPTDREDASSAALEALGQGGSSAAAAREKKHPRCKHAKCKQDDPSTPGDDRAGYVSCSDPATQASMTCGPNLGCCSHAGPSCAADGTQCSAGQPFFDACDGPEDCAGTGYPCWQGRFGNICSTPAGGFNIVCHTNADCTAERPLCSNARCNAAM
jgi:hypothetical protein